jgi:hypothetical protein
MPVEKEKEDPVPGEELVVRINGASIDKTLDDLIRLALADINVRGFKDHIDSEFIFRELVSLVKKQRVRDSVKHDSIRTLAQLLGLLGPTDRSAQPASVNVTFSESLAPDAKVETAQVSSADARGTRVQTGERSKDAEGSDGKVGSG